MINTLFLTFLLLRSTFGAAYDHEGGSEDHEHDPAAAIHHAQLLHGRDNTMVVGATPAFTTLVLQRTTKAPVPPT